MIQRRTLLKSLPLAAAGMAGAGALASCGSSGGGGGSAGEGGTLTWMSMLHTPTTPEASGPIMTALKEHSGVDFEFQWVPDASKEEKINAALASGSLADINTLNQGMMMSASDPEARAALIFSSLDASGTHTLND